MCVHGFCNNSSLKHPVQKKEKLMNIYGTLSINKTKWEE